MLVEDFVEGYHEIESCFDMDRRYIAERARMLFNYRTMTKQYLKAYEKVIDIVHTRERQKQTIRRMAAQTRTDLSDIWTGNTRGNLRLPSPSPAGRGSRHTDRPEKRILQ
jgi:hypothetical protein